MSVRFSSLPSSEWLRNRPTLEEARELLQFLEHQGTFEFTVLESGLFPAAAGTAEDHSTTGYANVWVRDNIHIAWAHHVVRQSGHQAADCICGLMKYFSRHRYRFRDIIEGRADPQDPMKRPHIRFDGRSLTELPEKWSHAQNDALGYFLWLTCRLVKAKKLASAQLNWRVIADLVHYWQVIRVWQDEDSGHWEETRKVSASSIGTALAGLMELQDVMRQPEVAASLLESESSVQAADVQDLAAKCRAALDDILPLECRQPEAEKHRRFDSALLFLIYPLNIVSREMADRILADVAGQLTGDYGIRRYQGDSYWCADYRQLLNADVRTSDFSDNLETRDRMLRPGTEAEWCIFDPIISCIYGERFHRDRDPRDFEKQLKHLQRSLSQLTQPGSRYGAWRCPESYFLEGDSRVPNDITPLLWTQANLWQALHHLIVSCG